MEPCKGRGTGLPGVNFFEECDDGAQIAAWVREGKVEGTREEETVQ